MNEGGRRYRILGTLGRGGFGTVYRAEMLGEGGFTRAVALKVLNADVEGVADVARRLRDEARLLGMLRHRAILQVDGLVRIDDRWTVVMEYVEGADLSRVVAKTGQIPAGPALEIIGEVASALHLAYNRPGPSGEPLHLLHRDIKPQNIMVTPAGEVKVLDFGIARAEFDKREAHTRSVLFGSVGYMAPERFELEERAEGDVYSLGVVLYEMLTGEAFGKATLHPQKFMNRMAEAVDTMRRVPTPPPASVVDLVQVMMAYEPDERPSAREVESLCRDLRTSVPGPWLRDWAEIVVTPVAESNLEAHDFSKDVVSESSGQLAGPAGNATTDFQIIEGRAGEAEAPSAGGPPPPPGPSPAGPPPPPATTAPAPPLPPATTAPAPPPAPPQEAQLPTRRPASLDRYDDEPPRRRRRAGGGAWSALKTFTVTTGILSSIAMIVFSAWFIMVFFACCGSCLGGSGGGYGY